MTDTGVYLVVIPMTLHRGGVTPIERWVQMCRPGLWGIFIALARPMGPKIRRKFTCPGYQSWFQVILAHFQFLVYIFLCRRGIKMSFCILIWFCVNFARIMDCISDIFYSLPGLWVSFFCHILLALSFPKFRPRHICTYLLYGVTPPRVMTGVLNAVLT